VKPIQPPIVTVGATFTIVPQRAAADQHLSDLAAAASAVEGIRQGLADVQAGRTRPARAVFDAVRGNMP
jgi:hypothetical protein